MKLTETYEWNHVHSTDNLELSTTQMSFEGVAGLDVNTQNLVDYLESIGIKVKTEYGNYRPTLDVLKDISEYWDEKMGEGGIL